MYWLEKFLGLCFSPLHGPRKTARGVCGSCVVVTVLVASAEEFLVLSWSWPLVSGLLLLLPLLCVGIEAGNTILTAISVSFA